MASAEPGADRVALREALLRRRRALTDDFVDAASRALVEVVTASPSWRDATSVAAFYGVRREPHTAVLLGAALADGKSLWLPAVRGELAFCRIAALGELLPAGFGLVEPPLLSPGVTLGDLAPALVLVPGLGFASNGARIGFGRGYYDRALAPLRARDDCVRMGVCFAAFLDPIEGAIPMEGHDVPMQQVATERGIIRCST